MASRAVEELVTGIWCWEKRPRGLRPDEFGGRTSYAVVAESDLLLVDPLVDGADDPVVEALDDLVSDSVRILVTMPYHTRSAEWLWRRYRNAKARIYGHPAVATRLGDASGLTSVLGGSAVDGIARFHSIGRPHRSQQPIEIPAVRALVFGDAIVEIGDGDLRIWAAPPDSDRRRTWWNSAYHPSLERLAGLDIEHVLVTHGRPAIGNGKEALQHALRSAPWQRPKRATKRTAGSPQQGHSSS
jgi:glyoxylase-like metal-dependent hydrolase (beta-lactamase superfamily II)